MMSADEQQVKPSGVIVIGESLVEGIVEALILFI